MKMEQPAMRAAVITLEQFPLYLVPSGKPIVIPHLSTYLKKFVSEQLKGRAGYLELPSLTDMAGFFKCSYLDLYDIFRTLRTQGYDYRLAGLDGAVHIWIAIKEKS